MKKDMGRNLSMNACFIGNNNVQIFLQGQNTIKRSGSNGAVYDTKIHLCAM